MEPVATLDQVRQIDYESRRDRCSGLIFPAAKLFAKRVEAKEANRLHLLAPIVILGAAIFLHYALKQDGDNVYWALGAAVVGIFCLEYFSRGVDNWLRERRIRELDEQLSMMSGVWMGAGASGEHFYGLQKLIQDGDIDSDSDEYGRWFYSFDKFLRIRCGLEYSELNKALHQMKKSA